MMPIDRESTAERRELEMLHRTILMAALDGFLLVDLDGRILEVNEAYCRMSGYSEDELLAMCVADLEDRDSEQEVAARIGSLREVGHGRFHTRHRRKDGTPLELEVSVQHHELGGGRFVTFLRDTTHCMLVETALLEGEQQLRNLSENLADGMVYQIDSGPDGTERRFTYVSPAVERMHGLTVQQVMEDPACLYGQVDRAYAQRVVELEAKAFASMSRLDIDVPVRLPSGENRWRRFISAPRRISDGCVVWDGIEMDITERVQADAERERLQDQLIQARKMESLGRMAGGIAHDFNNMLNVILGHTEMLLEGLSPSHPFYQDVEQIGRAARHSADLTGQLLALARKQPVVPRVIDPNAVVDSVAHMLRRVLGGSVALSWLRAANLWCIKMDAGQLGQILTNLCVNARDAILELPARQCVNGGEAGGVSGTVTIRTANVSVDPLQCRCSTDAVPGDYVLLSVTDDGCGMEPETLARAFEPFFTTKSVGRGVGLGLATTYGIVRQNGGFIDVASELGKGTSFRIYLPRCLDMPA